MFLHHSLRYPCARKHGLPVCFYKDFGIRHALWTENLGHLSKKREITIRGT